MEFVTHPKELNFAAKKIAQMWIKWCDQFKLYLHATESDTKADKIIASILLTFIGSRGRDIYSTFVFENEEQKNDLQVVIETFNTYCQPRKNLTFLTSKFFTCKQKGKRFNDYATELCYKANQCKFGKILNRLIKDM